MKHISYYKKDIDKTNERMQNSIQDTLNKKVGNIVLHTYFDVNTVKRQKLTNYNFNDKSDLDKFIDESLIIQEQVFEVKKEVNDIYIPQLGIEMGIGDFGAFVAGDITFTEDTSWNDKPLKELRGFKDFPEIGTSVWYEKIMYMTERMLKKTKGTDIPFSRGFFSPMDLAEALRGDKLYYDMFDDEKGVHDLLQYCTDVLIKFGKDIVELMEYYNGDNPYRIYLSKNGINMSEDIACIMSPDTYTKFCAPYTQQVIDAFGVGYMHCHSRAPYLIEKICSLNNVATLWYAQDPKEQVPIDNIDFINKNANSTMLSIDAHNVENIEKNIDLLKKGNYSLALACKNKDEAIMYADKFNKIFNN